MNFLHLCRPQRHKNYLTSGFYVTDDLRSIVGVNSVFTADPRNAKRVIELIKSNKIDVMICHKVCGKKVLSAARKNGVLTICWYYDCVWGSYAKRQKQILSNGLNQVDLFFATDGGSDQKWRNKLKIKKLTLRQGVYSKHNFCMSPEEARKHALPISDKVEIAFIGTQGTPYRRRMLAKLKRRYGARFALVGNVEDVRKQVRDLALNALLTRVKIVVGESYPSPNYWSNRVYEMCGRGGFLIHNQVGELSKEFSPGEEIELFDRNDLRSLTGLIDRYLDLPEKIRRIKANAVKRCPTYKNRLRKMLKIIAKRRRGA